MKYQNFEHISPPHITELVNGYLLKVFESDPYYYVEVFSIDGVLRNTHLLSDDTTQFELLKDFYKHIAPRE